MRAYVPLKLFLPLPLLVVGCQPLELDPPPNVEHLVFDLSAGEIPLPNDIVRDSEGGHLDLPTDDEELSATEFAFREYLNGMDAWSSTFPISIDFSAVVDPETVTEETLQVWEWGANPQQVTEVTIAVDEQNIVVDAPREGWKQKGDYVVLVRGGDHGLHSEDDAPIGPDASFYFLKQQEKLDTWEHQRAFPGATREERLETAETLEEIRLDLAPYFTFFDELDESIPRDEIAGLWHFTITGATELAMDKASQRVPLPFDLLIDPETGLVELTAADWDDELVVDAKEQANKLDGFGVSPNLMFELTQAVDPSTVNSDNILLYDLSVTPTLVDAKYKVMAEAGTNPCYQAEVDADCKHIIIGLEEFPLKGGTTYGVVVKKGLLDHNGEEIKPMPIGHFMATAHPIAIDGQSQISSLDDESADRLEGVRVKLDGLLDDIGRENVLTAWPFTTMDAIVSLREAAQMAETMELSSSPSIMGRKPAYDLLYDDALSEIFPGDLNPIPPFYIVRTLEVAEVVQGTIQSPYFLDEETRRWRDDGGYEMQEVHYQVTIPDNPDPTKPVVIFGHAVVTDRRFGLLISGELAKRGYASISIDFPFHGKRTVCIDASLCAIPNFLPMELRPLLGFEENLMWLPPCVSGNDATCSPTGECLDADGNVEDLLVFPVIDLMPAGGAAFLDVYDMPHINEHFRQALVDLGALRYSLQSDDWTNVFGGQIRTDQFYYIGQSLGGIVGFVYVSVTPEIERAVFNVPGGSLVHLFQDSEFFGPQIGAYFENLDVDAGSFEQERLLNTATWLVDSVDPHTVAHLYAEDGRTGLIQMDKIAEGIG
ncbi:MAG: hypothetical protein HN348_09800, partial [Proteobacteria bacterium]|nr:hypothetical protein [Pseudomonadota bacterium]